MSFFNEYSWRQAFVTSIVLILGSMFIFAINSKDTINPAWGNFFLIIPASLISISFFPVILTEKIITPIKERKN
jgi:hypothetical protein